MMATKKKAAPEARSWARTKGGNVKRMFTIRPQHERELDAEAAERAHEAGSAKPDASAVLREVLDAWVANRKS
jgi:hypothetical protein